MLKVTPIRRGKQTRMSYGKIREVMDMPNLIEVQKNSFRWFLDVGLREIFRDIAEITDYSKSWVLTFVDYRLDDKPKYTVRECKERDATYAAPMRVKARLLNKTTGVVKESDIYMGDFPLMTESGTFVVNGAERVIVSQLVRSPGVYYSKSYDKTGLELFSGTINPNRGAWLEFETDINNLFYVRIDKNRKLFVTTFIRALGLETDAEIREFFGEDPRIEATLEKDEIANSAEAVMEVFRKLRPGEPVTLDNAREHLESLFFDPHRYDISRVGRYKYNKKLAIAARLSGYHVLEPVADPRSGELLAEPGELITKEKAYQIEQAGVTCAVIKLNEEQSLTIRSNGMVDAKGRRDEDSGSDARKYDYLPQFSVEQLEEIGLTEKVCAKVLFEILDQNLSADALLQALRSRLDELIPKNITLEDIFASVNYVNCLAQGVGKPDDIDHLGNRRIRCVGELLQNQFRIGIARMEKLVREKMTLQAQDDAEKISPATLINIRPVSMAIKEFFGSSPLSQFMDQTNPLAELTHKRRLSALGPGGLSRDRAGFEVRDVHYSHYGRMCPIETPEGQNVGLITYLATFAKINRYGFVEAPYRRVENGVVLDRVRYMTADAEDDYIVAQANEPLDENGRFINARVNARHRDEYLEVDRERVHYMDVSPKMVVSVATAMIPFLENDDANRALMGSNMQRQAVPLLKTDAPLVGTGMEYKAAVDSGVVMLAKEAGTVAYTSADLIVVENAAGRRQKYELIKFMRSNHGTCINQRPIVSVGEQVKAGQVIADGPATDQGEISLGKNALIAFMTWEGYNYEDAVLVNEKIVQDDVYTSIHIEQFELEARDTKLGAEEITRDIPNVGDDAMKDLDDRGIIRVGAEVHSGDILVGKVTPKGETELTAEERLLRAIFGEKVKEVRDTSLRLPHGEYGIVVNVEVFTRENSDELSPGVNMVVRCYIAQKRKLSVGDKMAGRHGNKGVVSRILPQEDMPFLDDGTPLDIVLNPMGVPSRMNIGQVLEVHLGFAARQLGKKNAQKMMMMTPVFDGAHESDIREALIEAGVAEDGKSWLFDGRTGRRFDNRVTVGVMYFLKLLHLVDDKIHARSTGPYSLVTQQPLGGKAQFGGQRFGEMEVWALEAYGAAYTLQEILTVKSDDVVGRVKTYEAIVKGKNVPQPSIPESFKVLVKELQSLALDVRILDGEGGEIDLRQTFDDEPGFGVPDERKLAAVNPADLAEEEDAEELEELEDEDEGIETGDLPDDLLLEDGDDGALPSGADFLDDYNDGYEPEE
ncbi:MAG: DNA-directed RNA polymerase subunit beta [Oscillospiraceae bacterium]|jgi:DNA-directed RNA polymerase subunit beta|nr:DNA-directed RNA polymerase subunit beta [Oscillospiraceae bacterium]